MIPAGYIIDNVLRAMHAQNDKDQKERVWRVLNQEYFDICREISMPYLREFTALDFTADDGTGLWLPSNLAGIDSLRDDDDEFEFYERNRSDIDPDEDHYRFERYCPNREDVVRADDLTISNGASAFTSSALSTYAGATSVINEYVRFDKELGFYKITAGTGPFTITPKYWGPSLSNKVVRCKPKETQKIRIYDESDELLDDRTCNLHYWRFPDPLYFEDEVTCLPKDDYLELRVLRKIPEAKSLRPVSQNELDRAKEDLLRNTPDYQRHPEPKDIDYFEQINMNSLYDRRGE